MRNRYDADGSSICLVQRPPPWSGPRFRAVAGPRGCKRRLEGGVARRGRLAARCSVERNGPRASSVSSPGVEELLAACLLPSFAIVSFLSVLVHSSVPID